MISFLGSEIGRGHPFYLDGLVKSLEALGRGDLIARRSDVFHVSRGLSRLAWSSIRQAYAIAGRGGTLEALYRGVRGQVDYDSTSVLLRILGRDLRRWAGDQGLLVVDHPAVVGALSDRGAVWYVHGEHAAPPESIARRAARVFVPTQETAARFERGGMARDRIAVTGICVDPALVPDAPAQMAARRERIAGEAPLTLGFFSSGAEPVHHVAALARAAVAASARHRALVFAQRGGRLEREVARMSSGTRADVERIDFTDREEIDRVTAEHFDAIDVVVSPPHERSNWALALGVPFFLVGPDVGPFAPENRALLLREGVAVELASPAEAAQLPGTLDALRASGELLRMSRRGSDRPLDGFAVAARLLVEAAEGQSSA